MTSPSDGGGHPARSDRPAALAWAEAVRVHRRTLRDSLRDGSDGLEQLIGRVERGDADDGSVRLLFVLESLPGAGKVDTRRRLHRLGLEETTPLRDLDPAERRSILQEFSARQHLDTGTGAA